jgi:hypothetical protein
MKLKALLVFIAIITSLNSFAEWKGASLGGGGSSKKGFYFSLAAKGMLGTTASADNESVESRSSYVYGGETVIGMTFSSFLIGVAGEYNLWKQKTKPSEVSDTNTSGTQINMAPVIGVAFGGFLLTLKPYLYSTFTFTKEDASGNELSYKSPSFPSYGIQLSYRLGTNSFVGVEYSKVEYKTAVRDGEDSTLSDDAKTTLSGMGLVYGFKF